MILQQVNCASTCSNQSSGSSGQKGGNLRATETVETSAGDPPPDVDPPPDYEPDAGSGWTSGGLLGLDIAQISRLGHQLWQGIGKGTYSIVATIWQWLHLLQYIISCQIISEFEEADADYLSNLQSTEASSASSLMDYEDDHNVW